MDETWKEYNAQVLLDARRTAGLTQQGLAERLGVDKGYISRVERGKTIPSAAMLYKMAAAMGFCVELKPV